LAIKSGGVHVGPPIFLTKDSIVDFIKLDSKEPDPRGSKFMIAKEAFDLEGFLEIYQEDLRITTDSIFNFIKEIISNYGADNVNINPHQIKITNDDIDDYQYLGFDNKKYDFSFGVYNRKGELQKDGMPKNEWVKAKDLLDSDTVTHKKITDTSMKDMLESVLPNTGNAWRSDLVAYYIKMLKSRIRGDKFNKSSLCVKILEMTRPPQLRNETFHTKGGFKINTSKKTISIPARGVDDKGKAVRYTFPYEFTTSKLNYDGKGTGKGGNFTVTKKKNAKNNVIILAEKKDSVRFTPEDPTKWYGVDCNIKASNWLSFYDLYSQTSFKWKRGEFPQRIIDKVKELNKEIGNKDRGNIKSKHRRPKRLQVVKYIPRKLDKYITRIFTPLVKKCKATGKGLAIDGAAFGHKAGNFGQENIRRVVPKLCREMGVPCLVVPPKNTSKTCSSCGHIVTYAQNKKFHDTEVFDCPECDNVMDEASNAAKNIALYASRSD